MRHPLVLSLASRLFKNEPTKRNGVRVACIAVWHWARDKAGRGHRPSRLSVTAPNGQPVPLVVWHYTDVLTVREIFLDRDYRIPAKNHVETILDLGGNVGIAAAFFHALYPQARIVTVEPNPTLFDRMTGHLRGASFTFVRAAVAPHDGTASFFVTADGWYSSLTRPAQPHEEIHARLASVSTLLRDAGLSRVDLVKVDIEGGEWSLLEGGHLQTITDCIVGELHDDGTQDRVERARDALEGWDLTVHESRGQVSSFTAVRK